MSYNTQVQLRDASERNVLGQYYDPAQDKYVLGNAALMGINSVTAATLVDSLVVKSGPCNLFGGQVCTTSAAGYLMLLDAATVPDNGPVVPKRVWPVAINTALEISFPQPIRLNNGAVMVFSTTGLFTLTKSATAFMTGEATNG